ncbi:MAG: hypothetical protein KIT60_30115 [Burkholderiaceae bacterium]|nr:hypothetical protein [Burkholderiaceae bacterium]
MNDPASMDRASYLKTIASAAIAAAFLTTSGAMLIAWSKLPLVHWLAAMLIGAALVCLAIVSSGGIVLARHRRAHSGAPDLYREANASRSAEALTRAEGFRAGAARRLAARMLLGHDFLVGDAVEVRSLPEILETLDENGCLGGMPFQAEMVRYCGQKAQVFRSVDKILDYGRTRVMRRLRGCVLLSDLRCDGDDHGHCQARCYLMWRTEWLRRPGELALRPTSTSSGCVLASRGMQPHEGHMRERFHCQFTHLHAASTPMRPHELGKDIRPLVAGNVTLRTWIVAMATRLFNWAQAIRGGTGWPALPRYPQPAALIEPTPLEPGDSVHVRSAIEIAGTLNERNKHRGLWFDGDQLKFCGSTHTVLARVERIIDDVHGQMLQMKTPCILLKGVDYAGETLGFSAQHDLFFWREVWLRKIQEPTLAGGCEPSSGVTGDRPR